MQRVFKDQNWQLYQQIINTAFDAIINIDESGNILEWNKSAEKTFGWAKEEVLGKPLLQTIIPQRYRKSFEHRLEHFRKNGESPDLNKIIEITAMNRQEKELTMELVITAVKIDTTVILSGFMRDISERKRAQEQFRQVVESAPYAMVMSNKDGKIELVNKAAELLFGYDRNELLGMNVEVLMPPQIRGQHTKDREKFNKAPQTRSLEAKRNLFGLRKDGKEIPVEIGLSPIETVDGTFTLASIIDIQERKLLEEKSFNFSQQLEKRVEERTKALIRQRHAVLNIMEDLKKTKEDVENAERKLRQQTAELTRSNEELEQFAYVASHDLQEPIRKIVGFSQLFEKKFAGQIDATSKEYIGFVVDGAKRMQALIQDLLQFSRVGRSELKLEPCDLNEVVKEAIDNLQATIEENKAKIIWSGLPTLSVHRIQMVQLFQNLIGNGVKYRREADPEIHIGADLKDRTWEFSVKDNGIGIESEFYDRLFVIFQRLHPKNKYSGTGIGLAVCKKIVQRHGGQIWVESIPGKGSIFKFTLPLTANKN